MTNTATHRATITYKTEGEITSGYFTTTDAAYGWVAEQLAETNLTMDVDAGADTFTLSTPEGHCVARGYVS